MPDSVVLPRCEVVVAGDVVVDHHLYEGVRRKPDIRDGRGVRHVRGIGGADGVRRLLEAVATVETSLHAAEAVVEEDARKKGLTAANTRDKPREIHCVLGVAKPDLGPPHAAHHAFALWRPHKRTRSKKEDEPEVWRTDLAMGYGHDPIPSGTGEHVPKPEVPPNGIDVLVLDDAGSLFRKAPHHGCWHLQDLGTQKWILLKLSEPIAQGDLWRALVPAPVAGVRPQARGKQLVVLVSAEDLRRESVRIGEQLSWERTLRDLANELGKEVLGELRQAAHLIVTFGGDAAIWIDQSESSDQSPRVAHFCFDGEATEGEFASRHDGRVIGYMTCMAAAVAYALTQVKAGEGPRFEAAMESGLRGMRDLLFHGHGPCGEGEPDGFPVPRLAEAMCGPPTDETNFSHLDIPWPPPEPDEKTSYETTLDNDARDDESLGGTTSVDNWMIVESAQRPLLGDVPRSLVGLAESVLRGGAAVYGRLPHLRFGRFVTAERREIEALRGIRQIMLDYRKRGDVKDRPKSIGVFGPPGAGKSFAVKEIATELFGEEAWLEFNLSQFEGPDDLIGAFHKVRDQVLAGLIPVVFWDEFDSQNYLWLRSLLAPMQDGKFQEGQVTHPLGRAVFIFAGGTAASFEAFGPAEAKPQANSVKNEPNVKSSTAKGPDDATPEDKAEDRRWQEDRHWRLSKGPDFKSRLDAFYDVPGPNPRRTVRTDKPDPADYGYPLRRALLIRSQLKLKKDEKLLIDPGLARALLLASEYRHGARSLEKLVVPLAIKKGEPLRRSALPPLDQMRMFVKDPDRFDERLNHRASFAEAPEIELLAEKIHEHWRGLAEAGEARFNVPWNDLPDAMKEDNRAAARRIPTVLALVGLGVAKASDVKAPDGKEPSEDVLSAHLERNIERLAEAEHDGWQDFRKRNGWRLDMFRDDDNLRHPLLVPYSKLPNKKAKDKDRNSVRKYPERVAAAGFRIVWLDNET